MSKVKPNPLLSTLRGATSGNSNVYFRTNKRTGKVHTCTINNPYTGPRSAKQQAVASRFKRIGEDIRQRLQAMSPNELEALRAEYEKQHDVGFFHAFLRRKWNDQYDNSGNRVLSV